MCVKWSDANGIEHYARSKLSALRNPVKRAALIALAPPLLLSWQLIPSSQILNKSSMTWVSTPIILNPPYWYVVSSGVDMQYLPRYSRIFLQPNAIWLHLRMCQSMLLLQGQMSQTYQVWSVRICLLRIHPWLCLKLKQLSYCRVT